MRTLIEGLKSVVRAGEVDASAIKKMEKMIAKMTKKMMKRMKKNMLTWGI